MTTRSKTCSKCGETKAETAYYKRPTSADGLHGTCRSCLAARQRQTRGTPEARVRRKVYNSARYQANREQSKRVSAAWHHANKERVVERVARHHLAAAEAYSVGGRDINNDWLHREIGYAGAHKRVKHAFGLPSSHVCESASCTRQASEWALVVTEGPHVREAEMFDSRNGTTREVRYSLDPRDYRPLCHGCHTRLDVHRVDVFATPL